MVDAEEVFSDKEMLLLVPPLVLMLALSRFAQATQRRKHKRKYKKKERIRFLVLGLLFALMLALLRFKRWCLVLVFASYV